MAASRDILACMWLDLILCCVVVVSGFLWNAIGVQFIVLLRCVGSWIVHRSRLRLGHPHTYITVNFGLEWEGCAGCQWVLRQWRTQDFFFRGGSTNSVEDGGQRAQGSGGSSPLVSGSTQFANE
jgi:hypothetical protein